jgi:DNA-binding MarR family transcriptional regulator
MASKRRRKNANEESLSPADTGRLVALDRALRFARSELTADVTAQRLLILISVFFNQGLSQRELLTKLDTTSITALSRNLADLSAWTTRKTEGPGLIELRPDPMNLRIKRVFLTEKGNEFVRRWIDAAAAGREEAAKPASGARRRQAS